MAKEATPLICLVCFLQLGGMMVLAAAHGNHSQPGLLPQVKELKGSGTTWCIVKPSTSQMQLRNIIRYCCVEIGLDCSIVQPGGTCFLNNLVSDASVVMNIYYNVKGKAPLNCDFQNSGLTVTSDPSVGSCVYRAA